MQKVTIWKLRRSSSDDVNQELQWLGSSLGLFGLRDRNSSCFRVFITLVKHSQAPLRSDDIALQLHLSRGTVVHHLAKLMDAGIILQEHSGYILREQSLKRLIALLERDVDDVLRELEEVARDVDEKLGRPA